MLSLFWGPKVLWDWVALAADDSPPGFGGCCSQSRWDTDLASSFPQALASPWGLFLPWFRSTVGQLPALWRWSPPHGSCFQRGGLQDLRFEAVLQETNKTNPKPTPKGLFQPQRESGRVPSINSQPHSSLLSPMGAREEVPPSLGVPLLLSPFPPSSQNKAMGPPHTYKCLVQEISNI